MILHDTLYDGRVLRRSVLRNGKVSECGVHTPTALALTRTPKIPENTESMLPFGWSTALRRAQLSCRLVAQRLRVPERYREDPLDELLAALTAKNPWNPPIPVESVERDIRRVERWLSRTPGLPDTCLYRALGRYTVLSRAGLPAVFVMGIPRRGGDGDGHAWIEVFEKPFAESQPLADFAVTFRYPSPTKQKTA